MWRILQVGPMTIKDTEAWKQGSETMRMTEPLTPYVGKCQTPRNGEAQTTSLNAREDRSVDGMPSSRQEVILQLLLWK